MPSPSPSPTPDPNSKHNPNSIYSAPTFLKIVRNLVQKADQASKDASTNNSLDDTVKEGQDTAVDSVVSGAPRDRTVQNERTVGEASMVVARRVEIKETEVKVMEETRDRVKKVESKVVEG